MLRKLADLSPHDARGGVHFSDSTDNRKLLSPLFGQLNVEEEGLLAVRNSFIFDLRSDQIYTLFTDHHLSKWIEYIGVTQHKSLEHVVYTAGVDTLFNLEMLRAFIGGNDTLDSLLHSLNKSSGSYTALPRLYVSFIHSLRRHQNAVFSQNSSHEAGTITEQVQLSGMYFYQRAEAILLTEDLPQIWQSRHAILQLIEREHLRLRKDENGDSVLGTTASLVISASDRKGKAQSLNYSWFDITVYSPL